jgi:outer membrane protein assembly factor BamB
MRKIIILTISLAFLSNFLFAQEYPAGYENNWPQWRGPYANGVVPKGDPPIEWSESKNVKWKVEIPGKGHATPIIWEDQIILVSAVQTEQKVEPEEPAEEGDQHQWMSPTSTDYIHEFVVISVDRKNGNIQWQTTVREALPNSSTHQFGSWASNSPVTDGKRIYAYFGSQGLYCLNREGKVIWERDFGLMEKHLSFGEGSSPVLHEDKLIVVRDHNGQSVLYILNKSTGEDILKIERDEQTSWPTPYIVEYDGKDQIIASATNKIRSYDMSNGEVLWECSGMTRNVIPMPVGANGMVYLMSGFRGSSLLAIDLSKAKGELTDSLAFAWTYNQNTPYTPSPVLMNGKLYFLKVNNGYLSCLDAKTGKVYYSAQQIEGIKNIFTSPVGVKDRLYISGANGIFAVVKQGENFELLSKNILDDGFHASPVVVGNNLYLRGLKYLYCISED